MKKSVILESNGVPVKFLVEGKEIEVFFTHNGRKASALFEIEGGYTIVPASYFGPAEYAETEVDYQGSVYLDDESVIPDAELDLEDLERQALEKYEPVKPEPDYE